ncbi:MAG: hypothetical protein NT049_00030, partial [Planctomycetota bacterium]|nr:hypothetical protein [Planctomycetota bacterium]
MTPEEITKRIKDFRDKFQVAKGAVTTDMPGMKLDLVFNAPGTLEESRGLVQQGLTLSYALEGNKVVMAMDAEMTDGAMLRQWAMAGKAPTVKDIMNEKLFGVKGEVWARWKGPFR